MSFDAGERAEPSVAVLVPCRNEESTVAKVVADFRRVLPNATVYVYDNCSTDRTAEVAGAAGAVVRSERRPGKGHVVCRMFADVDADVYVLVDGDATYDPEVAVDMVAMVLDEQTDMVVGIRKAARDSAQHRRGHAMGNRLFTRLHRAMFGGQFTDVFSGYRVMSRRFVKSFPATARGFEIEAELAAHALGISAPCAEIQVSYWERPDGEGSKLRTFRDGSRILLRSMLYFKELKPVAFFGLVFALLTIVALVLGVPIVSHYLDTGEVPRLPTALLSAAVQIVAFISLTAGIILDSIARGRREAKRLHYLAAGAMERNWIRKYATSHATITALRTSPPKLSVRDGSGYESHGRGDPPTRGRESVTQFPVGN